MDIVTAGGLGVADRLGVVTIVNDDSSDGSDFLAWQRGVVDAGDLTVWANSFGAGGGAFGATAATASTVASAAVRLPVSAFVTSPALPDLARPRTLEPQRRANFRDVSANLHVVARLISSERSSPRRPEFDVEDLAVDAIRSRQPGRRLVQELAALDGALEGLARES